jgi:hypothetical protein
MRFRCARRGRNQLLVFPGKAVAFNSNPQPVRPWRALLKARSSRARAKKFLTHRTPDWQILARTIPACSTARVRLARTELDAFPDEHGQWHRQGKPGQKNDQHHGSHALTMSARAAKFRDGTNTSIRNVPREADSCARGRAALHDEAAASQVSKGGRPGEVDRKPEEGGDHCEHDADGKPLHRPPPAGTPPQAVPVLSVSVIWRFVGHHLRPRSRRSRDGWNAQQLDINDKYQAENDRNRRHSRRCDQA